MLNALVENFGALGVVLDGLAIASFVDMFAGFKHIKDIVGGIDKLINVKKMHDLASVVAKLSETPNIKISGSVQGELLEYSKLYDKLKQIADKLKSIPTLLQGAGASITEMSSAMATGIGATIGAIGLIVTGWTIAGIIDEQTHKVETQLKKLTEAQEAYNSEASGLEELNSELHKNKERLKELESIKTPSIVEQEEIERIKTENDLLEKQIELQQKLVDLKQKEYYDTAFKTFSDTYGITEYDNSARGLQYYSQAQGDRFQRMISDVTAELDRAKEQGNEKNIALLEEKLLKYETLYTEWQQDVLELRGELAGAEGVKYSEVVQALDSIINWWNGESSPFTNILNDSRFTDIMDALKSGIAGSFEDLEQLNLNSDDIMAFTIALNDAGYSLEDVIDALNRTEDASHITFSIDTSELDSARDNVKSLASSIASMSSAFAEQAENGKLSVDTIFEVMEAGYASALVVDQNTGAVTLNKEAYAALAQAKVIEQIATLQGIKASYEQQIANLNEAETTDAVTGAVRRLTAAEIQENAVKLRGYITEIDAQLAILSQIDMSKVTAGLYSVGSAASSAKSAISNLQSGMKTLLSQTMSWLKQQYNDSKDASKNYYQSQIDGLKDAKDAAKDRWDAEKEAIQDQKDAYDDLIDAQLELLRREKEADEYAKKRNDKAKEVSDIENQLLAIANDDSIEAQKMRLELQEKLAEAQNELNEIQSDREYDLRAQALKDEKDRYDKEIQAKLDAIDKMSKAEDDAYQKRIDQLQKYLDAVQSATISEAQIREEAYDWIENRTDELYQNLLKYNYEYGDGLTSTVDAWFKNAEGWKAWGNTFEEALNNIAKYLATVKDGVGGLATATQETMNELLKVLTDWQQALVAAGDEVGAQIVANFMKTLSTTSALGLELTSEMVSTIKDIAVEGDTALLEMTGKCIQYFNGLAASGSADADELWQGFQRFFSDSALGAEEFIKIISDALDKGDDEIIRYFSNLGKSMAEAEADGKEFSKQMSVHIADIAKQLWEMRGSMSDEAFSRMWQNFCNDVAIADNALYVHGQNMVNNYAAIANAAQATATIMSQITTANGQTQTSMSAKKAIGNAPLHQYAHGGVVDYTGPAQVHGSKANPEVVFNADAAAKLYEYVVSTPNLLKAAFEGAVGSVSVRNVGQPSTSASVGDIILNISGNADGTTVAELKKVASELKEEVIKSLNESMSRRGIMRSPRTI